MTTALNIADTIESPDFNQACNFDLWLDTFLDEKGIDLEQVLEVEAPDSIFGTNYMPVGVIVEAMKGATRANQRKIKSLMVRIDFANGDILHFIKHLAQAFAI